MLSVRMREECNTWKRDRGLKVTNVMKEVGKERKRDVREEDKSSV